MNTGAPRKLQAASQMRYSGGVPIFTSAAGMSPRWLGKALNLPLDDRRLNRIFEVHRHGYAPDCGIVIQAVYGIIDTVDDGGIYVGSSKDCHRRKAQHHWLLRKNKHHCVLLQTMCCGIDDNRWRFIILEEVDHAWELTARENSWRRSVRYCIDLEDRRERYLLGL